MTERSTHAPKRSKGLIEGSFASAPVFQRSKIRTPHANDGMARGIEYNTVACVAPKFAEPFASEYTIRNIHPAPITAISVARLSLLANSPNPTFTQNSANNDQL